MTEDGICSELSVIRKDSFEDFINSREKKLSRKSYVKIEEKEEFLAHWNDYIEVIL